MSGINDLKIIIDGAKDEGFSGECSEALYKLIAKRIFSLVSNWSDLQTFMYLADGTRPYNPWSSEKDYHLTNSGYDWHEKFLQCLGDKLMRNKSMRRELAEFLVLLFRTGVFIGHEQQDIEKTESQESQVV